MHKVYFWQFEGEKRGWQECYHMGSTDFNDAVTYAHKLAEDRTEEIRKQGKLARLTSSVFDGKLAFTVADGKHQIMGRFAVNTI